MCYENMHAFEKLLIREKRYLLKSRPRGGGGGGGEKKNNFTGMLNRYKKTTTQKTDE